MTTSLDQQAVNCENVRIYSERLISALENVDPNEAEGQLVDILGALDKASKDIKKFVDNKKKEFGLDKNESVRGENYTLKMTEYETYIIDPDDARKELSDEDFLRVVKVDQSKLKPFLPKNIIESLRKVDTVTERYTFSHR